MTLAVRRMDCCRLNLEIPGMCFGRGVPRGRRWSCWEAEREERAQFEEEDAAEEEVWLEEDDFSEGDNETEAEDGNGTPRGRLSMSGW